MKQIHRQIILKSVGPWLRVLPTLVILLGMVTGSAAAATATASPWDVRKINGDDYVSADNIKQFYHFGSLSRSGSIVTLENAKVMLKLNLGTAECTMNNVKFVFSKAVEEADAKAYVSRTDLAKLIDPVLRPNFIKNAGNFNTVVLDAGHGGKDPGATNAYGNEADYTLKVACLVKAKLLTKGYKVVMTRDADRFLSLQERVNVANAVTENAIFIAIHFNSGATAARGIETFTLSPPGVAHYGRGLIEADKYEHAGNEHDSANMALATSAHGSVLRTLGTNTFDRGIKRARYTVLSGITHPAILLEGGFLSHPYEARLIDNEKYQAALASGIAKAVDKYRVAVTPPPAISATR
ncbi:MAG: N-acetylmuramoyl-L-alanine amidase [Verrucomicrobia bacterium]|nr:MAG: N-acetylmuramoyl-L-alanine amidase [Verrucomicrobiota bacterium]